jgi:translation initiation factor 3 subunit K
LLEISSNSLNQPPSKKHITDKILNQYSYQFNPHLTRDETIINVLVKSLTVFPSPDYSLALSLLPPHVTLATHTTELSEAVSNLSALHSHLNNAEYAAFWSTLESTDEYSDLVADVQGFEDTMRIRIAVVVSQCMQSVRTKDMQSWLNLSNEAKFKQFVGEVCGWKIEGEKVVVPLNKENEARSVVQREDVKFNQFARLIKRSYEQPA